jgi:Topoisomerase IA
MSYAKVLGATSRQDGYLEGNGYLVSWCVGHLVELAPPNVYDEKFIKWSIADLPILPEALAVTRVYVHPKSSLGFCKS